MAAEMMKVLLIEDNPGDILLIQEFLKEVTTTVVELIPTQHLNEALNHLVNQSFDVILLDLSLPDSQGLDTFVTTHNQADRKSVV